LYILTKSGSVTPWINSTSVLKKDNTFIPEQTAYLWFRRDYMTWVLLVFKECNTHNISMTSLPVIEQLRMTCRGITQPCNEDMILFVFRILFLANTVRLFPINPFLCEGYGERPIFPRCFTSFDVGQSDTSPIYSSDVRKFAWNAVGYRGRS
jgi:hypothetical protein